MSARKSHEEAVEYLLPLQWSLHYVMTDGEWRNFRNRVKKINPDWDKCTCPNQCKANTLDEEWEYDKENHIKRFVKAEFICGGCHWRKSPGFRLNSYRRAELGKGPPATKIPHAIFCLGMTQEELDELREKDLAKEQREMEELERIEKEAELGLIEIRYWTADLSAMSQYGYSPQEIAEFEKRMNSQRDK
jgi:hypothetical protein